MDKHRMYEQAFETAREKDAQPYDIINPFTRSVDRGIYPTITTRPEGLKTAILGVLKN